MINEPKYDIENGKIVNASTRVPIPDDEPIIIFRAKDKKAVSVVYHYMGIVENEDHSKAVATRLAEFLVFKVDHSERMKEPDTQK